MTVHERDRIDPTGYELADRTRLETGRVFLSGVQAIARLPGDQLRLDRRRGLTTAAFVSGYQGSPVASFGDEIARAAASLPDLPIVWRPGVNEELAATAVMGSQLAVTLDDCRYDGVLGIWYGKAPGLDRAGDAIRHAVFAGTAHRGGVVAVVGDDPAAKSSTLPSSSDATLVDLHVPMLFPGDVQEALDLARHAVALSRASGMWAGLKLVTPVADGTGTVDVSPDRVDPVIPAARRPGGEPFVPFPNGRLLTPTTLEMEREFVELRSEVAREYGVVNGLNRMTVRTGDDWIGIVASGHTYHEMREALGLLGLRTDDQLRDAGVRLFQLLMPVPIDPRQLREFADGLAEVVVVEEKNPTLERLVRDALYDATVRPLVSGRRDPAGEPLIRGYGALDADSLVEPLRRRLATRLADRLAPAPAAPTVRPRIPLAVARTPHYCSGCPHNLSTRTDPDTLVGGGIGCHAMIALMEPERVGHVVGLTAMGGEGAQWIGMSPFVTRDHLVQNLGDGTFFHSGSLAVRAAVAAGVHLTYKLLVNGTVAMTGGQDAAGAMPVPDIVRLLLLEGVSRVIVTTDDVDRYAPGELPESVEVWDRTRLAEAERVLADTPGVTVLLHDQACAAEVRRARSRGRAPTPTFRVMIDERVCEGCGDCGDVSNCLSVQPIDTPFGRKTAIHQTSCNLDLSCLRGDCPSFVTVTVDAEPDRAADRAAATARAAALEVTVDDLPDPVPVVVDTDTCSIRMSGIGGTGVVTISQILGTAAMLDGATVRGLDQTGLSQKAGPVVSDLRLTRGEAAASNHTPAGGIDCFLAFDLLVAAGDTHRAGAAPGRTVVIAATDAVPTGHMVTHPDEAFPALEELRSRLDEVSRPVENRYVDAGRIAEGLFGATTTVNVFLAGVAVQSGAIPVRPELVERAIELNGVAVASNRAAFRWGRRWVVDPEAVHQAAGLTVAVAPETFEQLVDRLADDLRGHSSAAAARRYREVVARVAAAEDAVDPTSTAFRRAVAVHLHRLMAYKDEYEVARLLLLPEARARYERVGGADTRVTHHLHPPALRALGMRRKLRLRRSAGPLLRLLRLGRPLRGTPFDPFGYAEVRRVERAMIPEYVAAVDRLAAGLTAERLAEATAIAALPDQVRGYESLKLRRAAAYREELADRLTRW